jgi:magnesium-transporting ATPase (P-type)
MAKSERYKSLKKKSIIFGIISYAALFITMLVCLIAGGINFNAVSEGVQIFTDEAKTLFLSMSITAIVGTILTFFLKEGVRTFLWIVCVVLSSIVFGPIGMYIVLGVWLIDDYVIHKLFLYYKNKLSIRKEIEYDREDNVREEDSASA